MPKTIVLISGGNRGIGLETVKALLASAPAASDGYHIYMGSRDESKGAAVAASLSSIASQGNNTVRAIQLDITSPDSVDAAVARVKSEVGRLDVLINNAGINDDSIEGLSEKMHALYDVNVVATARMTEAFKPLLLVPCPTNKEKFQKRIVNVTSSMGSVAQKWDPSSPFYAQPYAAYRCTKAALNMLTACTAFDLKDSKPSVKVGAYDPGWAATEFGGLDPEQTRQWGAIDPAISGRGCRDVVEGKRDGESEIGGMFSYQDDIVPW